MRSLALPLALVLALSLAASLLGQAAPGASNLPPVVEAEDLAATDRDTDRAALEARAQKLYLAGDLAGAAGAFVDLARATEEPGVRAGHLVTAAWLAYQMPDPGSARATLAEALLDYPEYELAAANYPQDFVMLFQQARGLVDQERSRQADEHLRRASQALEADRLAEARAHLERALEADPTHPGARYDLALVELRSGDTDAASDRLERLVSEAGAGTIELSPSLEAGILVNLGIISLGRGLSDDAAGYLSRAVELDPSRAEAWNNLGLVRRRRDDLEGALEAFEQARALDAESPDVATNLGTAYIAARRWTSATGVLGEAVNRYSDRADLWLNLGLARQGLGDRDGALAALRRALELDPADQRGIAHQAAVSIAMVNYLLGRPEPALEAARQATEWAPDLSQAWFYLGLAHQTLGRLDEALRSMQRAADLDPSQAATFNNLGSILYAQGAYGQAADAYERALELRPDFEAARQNLRNARAQAASGAAPPARAIAPPEAPPPAPAPRRLGVRFAAVDYASIGLAGALVESVEADGAGARAGLRAGDLILRLNGLSVTDAADLERKVAGAASADVVLDLLRDGKPQAITIRF